jgi:hypothetical protein
LEADILLYRNDDTIIQSSDIEIRRQKYKDSASRDRWGRRRQNDLSYGGQTENDTATEICRDEYKERDEESTPEIENGRLKDNDQSFIGIDGKSSPLKETRRQQSSLLKEIKRPQSSRLKRLGDNNSFILKRLRDNNPAV